MMTYRSISIWMLIVILLIALGWIVYQRIEFYDEAVNTEWSLEARRNPFLAARLFLEQSGVQVVETDTLLKLPDLKNVSTLLITDSNQITHPRLLDQVLDWLQQGGTLIMQADSGSEDEDLLLQHFDIGVDWQSYDETTDSEQNDHSTDDSLDIDPQLRQPGMPPQQAEETAHNKPDELLTTITFDDADELQAAFSPYTVLTQGYLENSDEYSGDYTPLSWAGSEQGIHMLQFEYGSGLLTVVSDSDIWSSHHIGEHDHSYLLWLLIANDGDLAFLRPELRDSIFQLLAKYASETLIAIALFLVLLLRYWMQRFGRIEILENTQSRSLNEHLLASGHYLWRQGSVDHLLKPARDQIMRTALSNIPLLRSENLNEQQQYELISQHTGLAYQQIENAFSARPDRESELIQTIRLLQHMEKLL